MNLSVRKNHFFTLAIVVVSLMLTHVSKVSADVGDLTSLTALVQSLQQQVSQLQTTLEYQSATLHMQEAKIKALEEGQVKVTMAPRSVELGMSEEKLRNLFDEQLQKKIGVSDQWLKDLKFNGDMRLRWEAKDVTDGPGKTNDQNRFRYHLRFGWEKKFNPDMNVGFGLASQSANSEATSTNTSFDDSFTSKPVSIEKAYATYKPAWAELGSITGVELTGGKFQNPFEAGSSNIIWDRDVRPEGFYEKITAEVINTDQLQLGVYGLAGQYILEETSGSGDAELWAWQLAVDSKMNVGFERPLEFKSAFSFYNYNDFENTTSDGGTDVTRGNPTAGVPSGFSAEDFDIVEIYNEAQLIPFSTQYPVRAFFDWAQNVGDQALSFSGGGQDKAWAYGLKLGRANQQGSWEAGFEYRHVEINAVPGQFADGDFGFVNRRGPVFSTKYALTDNLKVGLVGYFTNNILSDSDLTGIAAAEARDEETRLFQSDLVWKF
jgi:cell division protein FtsB